MRIINCAVLAVVALLLTAGVGQAQDRAVHVNFGGGPTFMGGNLGDHFATGWGPAIGVTFTPPGGRIGFQFEYAYRRFDLNDNLDAKLGVLDANHTTHQLDFNAIANLTRKDSAVRGFVVAGPGMYNRAVEITKYEGTGVICDPYWYVCGAYPVESVVGSRGGWDFGMNFGGGVGFKIGDEGEFYIESKFHYVWGPDIQPTATPTGSTATGGSTN